MVEVEWRLSLTRFRVVPSLVHIVNVGFFNLRPGRGLRWKVKTIGWEGQGVVCGEPAPPRLYPPPVSVKDRWIAPRKQALNVSIAWWYMGPVR
jgi:hypothetical protein